MIFHFEWLEQAIYGLDNMLPFCVKGFMEPRRFLCMVSYWNCHIVCENDESMAPDDKEVVNEVSRTSMLQFCKHLYDDINQNRSEWVYWHADCEDVGAVAERAEVLTQKLICLRELITEREDDFSNRRCFL